MYALAWQAPKAKTNAKYRYCVTLSDRAGTVTGAELWPHPTEVALLSDRGGPDPEPAFPGDRLRATGR